MKYVKHFNALCQEMHLDGLKWWNWEKKRWNILHYSVLFSASILNNVTDSSLKWLNEHALMHTEESVWRLKHKSRHAQNQFMTFPNKGILSQYRNVQLYIYCIVWAVGLNPDSQEHKQACVQCECTFQHSSQNIMIPTECIVLFTCFNVAYKLMSLNPNFTYTTETYLQRKTLHTL